MASNIIETPIHILNDIIKESTPSQRKKHNLCTRIIQRKFKCIILGLILILIFSQILTGLLPNPIPFTIEIEFNKDILQNIKNETQNN
jgi:hypothetical protein